MTDIEDKLVIRRIIDIMQADDKFYCTKTRAKVTGIDRAAFNHVMTYFLAKNAKFINAHRLDVGR